MFLCPVHFLISSLKSIVSNSKTLVFKTHESYHHPVNRLIGLQDPIKSLYITRGNDQGGSNLPSNDQTVNCDEFWSIEL